MFVPEDFIVLDVFLVLEELVVLGVFLVLEDFDVLDAGAFVELFAALELSAFLFCSLLRCMPRATAALLWLSLTSSFLFIVLKVEVRMSVAVLRIVGAIAWQ